MASP
ncbi:2b3c4b20-9e85-48d0-9f89-0a09c1e7f326 [Thermothielavioides terrestris]|jgi:hypothetical protein